MAVLGTLSVILEANGAKFQAGMAKAGASLKGLGSSMRGIGIASAAGAAALGGIGFSAVKAASSAEETLSFMKVAFEDLSEAAATWAKKSGDAMGRSQYQMREMATTFQAMLKPITGSTEGAAEMAYQLSELSVDMASAFNQDDVEMMTRVQAALAGEVETLRRFGVSIDEATLAEFARRQGISKTLKQMTQAEKVQLRFKAIMEQTTDAQGDAARTSGSFANQLKRTQAMVRDAAVELGQMLMPVAQDVLQAFRRLVRAFRSLSPEAKKLLVFGGVLSAVMLAIGTALIPLGALASGLGAVAGAIAGIAGPFAIILVIGASLVTIFGALKMLWEQNGEGIKGFVDTAKGYLNTLLNVVFDLIDRWLKGFEDLFAGLGDLMNVKSASEIPAALKKVASGWFTSMGPGAVLGQGYDMVQAAAAGQSPLSVVPQSSFEEKAGLAADIAVDVGSAVKDVVGPVLQNFGESIKASFLTGVKGLVDLVPDDLKAKATNIWDQMVAAFGLLKTEIDKGAASTKEDTKGKKKATEATKTFADALKIGVASAKKTFKDALKTGLLGDVITAGGDAAKASGGDPVAVAIAAAAALAVQSEGFQSILARVNGLLQILADSLGGVLDGLEPIVSSLLDTIRPVLWVFRPLLRSLALFVSVLIQTTGVLKLLNMVFRGLFEAVKFVSIGILKAVRFVLKALGRSTKKVDRELKELRDTTFDAAGKVNDLGDAAGAAAAALSNVPEGWKYALARWRAIIPDGPGAPGGGPSGGPGGGNWGNIPGGGQTFNPGYNVPSQPSGPTAPTGQANGATASGASAGGTTIEVETVVVYGVTNVEDLTTKIQKATLAKASRTSGAYRDKGWTGAAGSTRR